MIRGRCMLLLVAVLLSGCGGAASVPPPPTVAATSTPLPTATPTDEPIGGVQAPGTGFGQQRPAGGQASATAPATETESLPTEAPAASAEASPTAGATSASQPATIFPLTDDATDVRDLAGQGLMTNYTSKLSAEEIMNFYRAALGEDGAVERELLTVLTEQTFSMVFDGWPGANGKAVVVQGTPLGPDIMNVNVRLESL